MTSKSDLKSRTSYDRLAPWYDLFSEPFEGPLRRQAIRHLQIETEDEVLDIGSGTGSGLIELARHTDRITGIDLSQKMNIAALKKITRRHSGSGIQIVCGNALKLPFKNESFDRIWMSFTLEIFDHDDMSLLLKECRRVLKPSGSVGILSLSPDINPSWIYRLYQWAHKRFPALIDCSPVSAGELLRNEGFQIRKEINYSLMGLPVKMIHAYY
jgi:demethylmenaquinone methyltransferase/2-methoxy-6-polyprenyl-1,4-benzoquinol methylase